MVNLQCIPRDVFVEVCEVTEGSGATGAGVGPLSGVLAHVDLQLGGAPGDITIKKNFKKINIKIKTLKT